MKKTKIYMIAVKTFMITVLLILNISIFLSCYTGLGRDILSAGVSSVLFIYYRASDLSIALTMIASVLFIFYVVKNETKTISVRSLYFLLVFLLIIQGQVIRISADKIYMNIHFVKIFSIPYKRLHGDHCIIDNKSFYFKQICRKDESAEITSAVLAQPYMRQY